MRIDPSGRPWVATAGLAALMAVVALGSTALAVGCGLVGVVFALFFRDPERHPPSEPGVVLAPADGRVLVAGPADEAVAPPGRWLQVSIFLSPLDVHVNRVPVTGRVVRVERLAGTKQPAYRREAARRNARTEIWFDTARGSVVCRQVAGLLARRVVCRLEPGMAVHAGDRFGIVQFGSRIDLFLPGHAVLQVTDGARVRAGETIVAHLVPSGGFRATEEELDDRARSGNNRA
jgi:phosphatidylserine decarboxylase